MKKRVLSKIKLMEDYIEKGDFSDFEAMNKYLIMWLEWIQHERLIHLIVTVTFGLLILLCFLGYFISQEVPFLAMTFIFAVTTGFYIEHYYFLENKTQYIYDLYDQLLKKYNSK